MRATAYVQTLTGFAIGQTVQLLCGGQCPTIRVGDYVEVDGAKQHEGLFTADTVTVTRR